MLCVVVFFAYNTQKFNIDAHSESCNKIKIKNVDRLQILRIIVHFVLKLQECRVKKLIFFYRSDICFVLHFLYGSDSDHFFFRLFLKQKVSLLKFIGTIESAGISMGGRGDRPTK